MTSITPTAYKTGMRVETSGYYVDQYGTVSWHDKHRTFPPCIGRKGECAYRRRMTNPATGAASSNP